MRLNLINPMESVGYLAYKVSRVLFNALNARFIEAGLDLTVEQWSMLMPIAECSGLTQGRLCEVMSQEKTGVSRLLAGLEKRGLVVRRPNEADRRVKHIYITPEGERMVERSIDLVVSTREKAHAGLDPEELATCCKVLLQIIRVHGGCPKADCGDCA